MLASRFQHDFSHVRVHTDEQAANAAASIGARAFTHESSIFFGAGQFDPSTQRGRHLLAHELTHVIQADSTRAHPSAHSNDVPALEHEAQLAAAAFASGQAIPPVQGMARGLSTPLRIEPGNEQLEPGNERLEERPTFGNLPKDRPRPGYSQTHRRVELFEKDGVWYERGFNPQTKARGSYDFVVRDGKIFGLKGGARGYGHTELAGGGRVELAGQAEFQAGVCTEWSSASGHYAPVQYFKDVGIKAGLPADKFVLFVGERAEMGPQLPVFQPKTGHLHPAGKQSGSTGPAPTPEVPPSPAGTPAVEPQAAIPPVSEVSSSPMAPNVKTIESAGPDAGVGVAADVEAGFALELIGGIVVAAILVGLQLFLDWLQQQVERGLLERDMKALQPWLEAVLKTLEPKIANLRKSSNVYARISIDLQRDITSQMPPPEAVTAGAALAPIETDQYKGVVPIGVDVVRQQASTSEQTSVETVSSSPYLTWNREHRLISYTVLIDDSFMKARAQAQQRRLLALQSLQGKGKATPPPASPATPRRRYCPHPVHRNLSRPSRRCPVHPVPPRSRRR